jgi:DNA polymerase delta subunit 4
MAPKRRASTQAASLRNQQATISFGKQGQNRVTKNTPAQHDVKTSKKEAALIDLVSDREISLPVPTVVENTIHEEQAKVTPVKSTSEQSEEETRARGISDAQIKKYWRSKEAERKAPRVHQQSLDVTEKMLREFDMSNQYGVSHEYTLIPQ